MPEPTPDPAWPHTRRVATHALLAGVFFFLSKLAVYALSGSAAVLSDALESTVNVAAAAAMLYTLWLSNRPPDESHPYGHGKAEFIAVALEGSMILLAGVLIILTAVKRLLAPPPLLHLDAAILALAAISLLSGLLGYYVLRQGRRHDAMVLVADGKHLLTDLATTLAVILGLVLVRLTGLLWLDPLLALSVAAFILYTGWRLLRESAAGLMDESDPDDIARISAILDDERAQGAIHGHHKLRARHTGAFHWIDFHIQVNPALTVAQAHDLASRIEHRIEQAFPPDSANATAHIEPAANDTH